MSNVLAAQKWFGSGNRVKKVEEGRCVKAIVLILPNRLDKDAATKLDKAAMNEVVKNVVPKVEASRWNLVVK